MLNKIDKAYKTAFAYQVTVWFMNVQLIKTKSETIHSIFNNKTKSKYSLVGFEPSGTVAPCLGLQDI